MTSPRSRAPTERPFDPYYAPTKAKTIRVLPDEEAKREREPDFYSPAGTMHFAVRSQKKVTREVKSEVSGYAEIQLSNSIVSGRICPYVDDEKFGRRRVLPEVPFEGVRHANEEPSTLNPKTRARPRFLGGRQSREMKFLLINSAKATI
jgi:hypothetical protein